MDSSERVSNMEIVFHGTREQLMEKLRALPALLAGNPHVQHAATSQGQRLANAFMARVEQSFQQKSVPDRTGDDGVTWQPHAPATIAKRARKDKAMQIALAWVKLAAQIKTRTGLPDAESSARAKGLFPLLHESGALLKAMQPGTADQPSPASGQIVTVSPGEVSVKITEKWWHHEGAKNHHFPARPFWPLTGILPASYWRDMLAAYSEGLPGILTDYLTGGG